MKIVDVSAQKTVKMPLVKVLQLLIKHFGTKEEVKFEKTRNSNIYVAKFKDNSKLSVASFPTDREGKTIAMIDNKGVSSDESDKRQINNIN